MKSNFLVDRRITENTDANLEELVFSFLISTCVYQNYGNVNDMQNKLLLSHDRFEI